MLVLSPEERVSEMQFCDDAAEAPDVDLPVVGQPEDYFRGSVVSALNVGVDSFSLETAGPEIDDLDS